MDRESAPANIMQVEGDAAAGQALLTECGPSVWATPPPFPRKTKCAGPQRSRPKRAHWHAREILGRVVGIWRPAIRPAHLWGVPKQGPHVLGSLIIGSLELLRPLR